LILGEQLFHLLTSRSFPSLYQLTFAAGLLAGGWQGILMNGFGSVIVWAAGYAPKSGSKSAEAKIQQTQSREQSVFCDFYYSSGGEMDNQKSVTKAKFFQRSWQLVSENE
jgi:hypothetical protein